LRRYVIAVAVIFAIAAAVFMFITQKRNADAAHAREAHLHDALASIRHSLAAYHTKHQRNPPSLADLVSDGELPAIPADPITGSNTTWKTTVEESVSVDDFQPGTAKAPPTIVDVHSGASGSDSAGRAFADY